MAGRRGKQDADDFVLHEAQPFGAAPPVTIFQQHGLRGGPRRDQFGLEELRDAGAKDILAARMFFGERVDRRRNSRAVETFVAFRAGLFHDAVHGVNR